ncbi:HAMP domain-containing histidine kinase [Corynebacterium sp. sy017]|nr:HAMP domain-containing histidine kinase [Corynebacterium sp. sy017]QDZ43492.1 HAMP domain-containing histidine kinase [Corynebacterium sp. sy039]TSD91506.1 HAMP domain-containing histidine kinase [Corynebacterium sp. SY003]
MVAVVVGGMTVVAYWTISAALKDSVDKDLEQSAQALLQQTIDPYLYANVQDKIDVFREYNSDIRVSIIMPGSNFAVGDDIPQLSEKNRTDKGYLVATVNGERVLSQTNATGATVIIARDMSSTNQLITLLGFSLLIVGLVGVFFAIIIGRIVATSGLRPVRRLHMAVNRVRKTDELTPIEVVGNDELAMLTHSFNDMLHALEQSRRRQAELVANAGHELKTPLTSMRTNIELLMMMQRSGSAQHMSAEDRAAIEHDVMAQMEELSTLIGDLVDLARDDAPPTVLEEVEMSRVIDRALDRVRRRRPDIEFTVNTIKWYLDGDSHGLERAILNLMDNAAKWSPQDGCVRIAMTPVSAHSVEITVSDSGPGIPVEDREKVFERFFRSVQARSTPGSGLGLAIVKQAILRHGGTISAMESEDGGTKMSVILPGAQTAAQLEKISQAKR